MFQVIDWWWGVEFLMPLKTIRTQLDQLLRSAGRPYRESPQPIAAGLLPNLSDHSVTKEDHEQLLSSLGLTSLGKGKDEATKLNWGKLIPQVAGVFSYLFNSEILCNSN